MPAEDSRKERRKPRRVTAIEESHDGSSHDRERELRRARGEVACAECWRCGFSTTLSIPIVPDFYFSA